MNSVCHMGVENANIKLYTSFWRTSQTILTWLSKKFISQLRMKRASTASILSQNNKACNVTNESVKIVITLRNFVFFRFVCKQLTTAKMHKISVAQKSCCACRVLSLATIRSKYYSNFILNSTRSGRELFDRASYCLSLLTESVWYTRTQTPGDWSCSSSDDDDIGWLGYQLWTAVFLVFHQKFASV